MPIAPLKPCCKPGCRTLTRKRFCDAHAVEHEAYQKAQWRELDDHRETAKARGYDEDWKRARRAKLARDPLCEECIKLPRVKPATMVHHIKPVSIYPELRLDADNLMSLCRQCHERIEGRKR